MDEQVTSAPAPETTQAESQQVPQAPQATEAPPSPPPATEAEGEELIEVYIGEAVAVMSPQAFARVVKHLEREAQDAQK